MSIEGREVLTFEEAKLLVAKTKTFGSISEWNE